MSVQGASRAKTAQSNAQAPTGSYSYDDQDRPRWDNQTDLKSVYDYSHASGCYAYSSLKGLRTDGKKVFLRGRRINGSSEVQLAHDQGETYKFSGIENYLKGVGDEPDLLYRLPELIEAMKSKPTDFICVCEGEKDVDSLTAKGFIATTNPNGALKWKPEFDATFAGRDVVILPDNDDVGRSHARKIVESVHPVARSVKVIQLHGLKENGDVTDWFDAGHTDADLLELVASTPAVTDPNEWAAGSLPFAVDKDGNPHKSIRNGEIALAKLGAKVSFDQFAQRYLLEGIEGHGPVLDDAALTHMRLLAEKKFRLQYPKERWIDIVTDYARSRSFHPVRDYLDALSWDGEERLDKWLTIYAGADDNEYVRAVGELVLVAAVRRVRKPGCKFDEMLVLESSQGSGKSSALACLAVREDWFADDLPLDSESKVVMERTAGRWIIELAELKGLSKSGIEHAKAMISRPVDKARLAYGRLTTEQPRQCIFFGTTNDTEYLRDQTGNRRYWPVRVTKFDLDRLKRDRDQLWAEAAKHEADGCSIRLDESLWAEAGEHQRGREIVDPFYEILSERLDGQTGKLRASDIWEMIGLGDEKLAQRTQDHNVRLAAVMAKLGWRRPKSKLRFGAGPQGAWIKGDEGKAVDAYEEVPRKILGLDAAGKPIGRPM